MADYRLTIKRNEVMAPPPIKSSSSWETWLFMILGDIALTISTFYLGGVIGGIALASEIPIEYSNIAVQTIRIGAELAFNLGMDKDSLTKNDGSINWNTIFIDSIFSIGNEGIPQMISDIRWLKNINKLQIELEKNGVEPELINIVKQYSRDFNYQYEAKKIDKIFDIDRVSKAEDRISILDSETSTLNQFKNISQLTSKYSSQNINRQLIKLLGEDGYNVFKETTFKTQIKAINKSLVNWNKELLQKHEKQILFQSLKGTPKWVRNQIFNKQNVKYADWNTYTGLTKVNKVVRVGIEWLKLTRYLNPMIAFRRLGSGTAIIIKNIKVGETRYIRDGEEIIINKTIGSQLKKLGNKIRPKIKNVRNQIIYDVTSRKNKRVYNDFESDLLKRNGNNLIKHFKLIPTPESQWILGYRIINIVDNGLYVLHIFFKPEATASQINNWRGKPPVITAPMDYENLLLWETAESKGAFYYNNFMLGYDYHKTSIILNFSMHATPLAIQSTLWNIMWIKRMSHSSIKNLVDIERWTSLDFVRLVERDYAPSLLRRVAQPLGINSYISTAITAPLMQRSFLSVLQGTAGRRTGIIVRRIRRTPIKKTKSNIMRAKRNKKNLLRKILR